MWLWIAFDPETKLIPSWRIGDRTLETAIEFMADLKGRLTHRVQLTSDGLKAYMEAVEWQNLTMRMSMRRFTRRTNGFSKKIINHARAVALHFLYYNFCRIHQSINMTPAMAAKVTNTPHDIDWLVEHVAETQPKPRRPKTYRKKSAA